MGTAQARTVALVTMGCTRNEVDSEEVAGRLAREGWQLVADPALADVAVVNTCGFIDAAKKDSIDTILELAETKGQGRTRAVVAIGCLAERYGRELERELPEADAVLGFDSYADLADHLGGILRGETRPSHEPSDRRKLLPLAPADRAGQVERLALPGHQMGTFARALPVGRPWAPLKIASGCDRRCSFCAIPAFRGSFVSRRPADVLTEARWLAEQGIGELMLVSENSTSYGKDLGDLALLDSLLPELAAIDGVTWLRLSYLQPAEVRPRLLDLMAILPQVAPWYDISFQHASPKLLRSMRRFGGSEHFLGLIEAIRQRSPLAGIRTNVIVGFPGESEADLAELEDFLQAARLDVVGVFGYSDEEGTEAQGLPGHLPEDEIAQRVARVSALTEELTSQRAEERVGEIATVVVDEIADDGSVVGRSGHQGPQTDGATLVTGAPGARVGDYLTVEISGSHGVDLIGRAR